MHKIQELQRLASPAPKPQSLAWDGATLWMGSRETWGIHALNPATWTVGWQTKAPGTPYGMTVVKGELRVLCGETADDHRIIRRCVPAQGFDPDFAQLLDSPLHQLMPPSRSSGAPTPTRQTSAPLFASNARTLASVSIV